VADAGGTLLSNGNLETWSSNVPSGWTLASGTAGTHMLQETGASNVYRGSSSAKFAGQGAGTIRLTQAVSPSLVQGKRRYFVGLAVKASATSAPATFRCCWSGTGYSEGSDKIEIAGGSLPTGWTRYGFFANFPAPLPSDWALKIETVDLEAAKSVYVDSVCAVPAVYHGGVGLAVVAGSSRWLKGDRLTFTLTNDQAGKFQRFFVRRWKTQLPSVAAANTIDEAWAT
jgi:hypothetical protein